MSKPYDFVVHNFGCKVNTYDAGLVAARLESSRHAHAVQQSEERPLVHVLNSCAVTQEATREALRLARRLKKQDPQSTVVLTGCAAQVDSGLVDAEPGIDLVVANSHKGDLSQIIDRYFQNLQQNEEYNKIYRSNIFHKSDLEPGGGIEAHHTRSFLKIQDGCNSFCSYCVIPFARGQSRSLSISDLIHRVNELVDSGVREVVLTGVHIADYEDGTQNLDDLVEAVLQQTTVQRLRLTSLEPKEISARLLEMFQDSRLCPHFHMSLQSGQDDILLAMRRRYTTADARRAFESVHLNIPDVFIGVDVITGFPGESEEQALQTEVFLQDLPWTKLHVFPYSDRPGTRAHRTLREFEVHEKIKKARAARLRSLSQKRFTDIARAQIGKSKNILLFPPNDQIAPEVIRGLSRDYWDVEVAYQPELQKSIGQEVELKIQGFDLKRGRLEAHYS